MKHFLVEVFVSRSKADSLAATQQRARQVAARLSGTCGEIRYVRAIYVFEDETCFYAFEAPSAALVAETCRLAGVGEGRVVEATTVEAAAATEAA